MKHYFGGVFFFSILFFSGIVYAGSIKECLPSLIKDTTTIHLDSAYSFALAKLITEKIDKKTKDDLDISIPIDNGSIRLGSKQANRYIKNFSSNTKVKLDENSSLSLVSAKLSDTSADAFKTCIRGIHKSGVRVVAFNATDKAVDIKIKWLAPSGVGISTNQVFFQVIGSKTPPSLPKKWDNNQSLTYIFERTPKSEFRFVANIGGDSDTIFVPYSPRVTEVVKRTPKKYPAKNFLRLAKDKNEAHTRRNSDCIDAGNQEEFALNPSIDLKVFTGHLNKRTKKEKEKGITKKLSFVDLTTNTWDKICWEAQMHPKSKEGGGDIQWAIDYVVINRKFTIEP